MRAAAGGVGKNERRKEVLKCTVERLLGLGESPAMEEDDASVAKLAPTVDEGFSNNVNDSTKHTLCHTLLANSQDYHPFAR